MLSSRIIASSLIKGLTLNKIYDTLLITRLFDAEVETPQLRRPEIKKHSSLCKMKSYLVSGFQGNFVVVPPAYQVAFFFGSNHLPFSKSIEAAQQTNQFQSTSSLSRTGADTKPVRYDQATTCSGSRILTRILRGLSLRVEARVITGWPITGKSNEYLFPLRTWNRKPKGMLLVSAKKEQSYI